MYRIDLTLTDHSFLTIYVDDYESFIDDLQEDMPMFILEAEYVEEEDTKEEERKICNLILLDGTTICCGVDDPELYSRQPLVKSCEDISTLDEFHRMVFTEKGLDDRLKSSYAVINNIPNKACRTKLHREYLKRKAAYVTSLEALIDGITRE
jgi:hypothetical protein